MMKHEEIKTTKYEYNPKYNIVSVSRSDGRKWIHNILVEDAYSKATISLFTISSAHRTPDNRDIERAKKYVDNNYNAIGADFLIMEDGLCI